MLIEYIKNIRFHILFILFLCVSCIALANINNDRIPGSRDAYLKNKIAAGIRHTLEIRNGTLWAWGNSLFGQVGDGSSATRITAVQIGTADNWVSVAAGAAHSLGIRADGTLWVWGYNNYGQLGDGTNTDRYTPVQVGTDNKWVSIAAGAWHTLGIKADGTLWAWGSNSGGQLGIGNNADKNTPVQVGAAHNWVSIAAGGFHSMAVKADGSLWAWGGNSSGQLGDGSTGNKNTPVRIGNANNWMHVAAGEAHSMAIKANGTLWAWGLNSSGQLGDSTTTNKSTPVQIDTARNWVHIVAGAFHSLARKTNGTLWAWGKNDDGQLGDNTNTGRNVPVHIDTANRWVSVFAGYYHSLGVNAGGSVMAWGDNDSFAQLGDGTFIDRKSPVQIDIMDEWTSIAAGDNHNLGTRAKGTLWVWGRNHTYQLGDSTLSNKDSIILIGKADYWIRVAGDQHSLGIKADGTLWAWGNNSLGQLGIGNIIYGEVPVQVGTDDDWVAIATGYQYSIAIKGDGTLWAWGYNHVGQLGTGPNNSSKVPIQVGTDDDWIAISSGASHNLAIKSDGTLWAWGRSDTYQLGNGSTTGSFTPTQIDSTGNWIDIAAAVNHSVALKSNGTLWAWGDRRYGQVGDGYTNIPSHIFSPITTPIQIGMDSNWISIATGHRHSLGIRSDGTLWTWGYNVSGQLGDGTNSINNVPTKIGLSNNWVEIAGGDSHSMGIKTDRGKLCLTGSDFYGQLGNGGGMYHSNIFDCICVSVPIIEGPASRNECVGSNTYFKISAYASRYQWQVNTGNGWAMVNNSTVYSGANTNWLHLTNVDTSHNNNRYRCIAYNECFDSTISDSAQLKVSILPAIIKQPQDNTVCANSNTFFSIATSDTSIKYQWQMNDGTGWNNVVNTSIYQGATTDTLSITGATTALTGYRYRCVAGDVCTLVSDSAVLNVHQSLTASVSILLNDTVCAGKPAVFSALPINGGANPIYQWQVNGTNAGTNSNNFSIAAPVNGDVVRCYMTSTVNCPLPRTSLSNAITVQVNPYVTPTISITSDRGTSWCSGKENIFRSANTNGGAQPAYQWKMNGVDIGPGADTLWVPYLNDGDVVECEMVSSEKCPLPAIVNSNKINMTIVPTTKASVFIMPSPDSIICQDKEVTMYCAFTNGGTTPAFQWMLNGKDIPGETMGTYKTASLSNGDIINCRFISSGTCVFPEVSNPVSFVVNPEVHPEVSITVLYTGDGQYLFTALPVNGGTNPVYRWYLNGKQLKDEYGSTVTLTGLTRVDKVWVEMASSECVAANMRLVSSKKITTGIEENQTSFKTLVLHPNPNKGIFVVEGDLSPESVQEVNMTILNSIGQVMHHEQVPVLSGKLNYTVTTKDLSPGGYLLKLDYEGGQDFRRFVIMK